MVLDQLKEKGVITDYVQAAKDLQTNKASISDIKSGRKKLSVELIRRMKLSYPSINIEWIIMGEGEPFINQEQKINDTPASVTDALIKKIGDQGEEIGRLRQRIDELERERGTSASGVQNSRTAIAG